MPRECAPYGFHKARSIYLGQMVRLNSGKAYQLLLNYPNLSYLLDTRYKSMSGGQGRKLRKLIENYVWAYPIYI